MKIVGMNHFNILTKNLKDTRRFYSEVLGLREGYRPNFDSLGAWFYVGDEPILHISEQAEIPPAGVIDHMAFSGLGLRRTLEDLKMRRIKYELFHQVGSNIWQVFFYDPNGAKIEIDFSPGEPAPAGWAVD
jgi:catechol 2,3-dioxygenase-like lactoylglutathione lyase family enzyme